MLFLFALRLLLPLSFQSAGETPEKPEVAAARTLPQEDAFKVVPPEAPALQRAIELFADLAEDEQISLLADVERRLSESQHPRLQRLLKLRDRACRELKVVHKPDPGPFDADFYAPGQVQRGYVDQGSTVASEFSERFVGFGSNPRYHGWVWYDFGLNCGVGTWGPLEHSDAPTTPLLPEEQLSNHLLGFIPDVDRLVAWLEHQLDHNDNLDLLAEHFSNPYSDLDGHVVTEITLYDAFSSMSGVDMPDVEVIAFARNILGDDSFVSPIPPGSRQTRLFETIHAEFLRYFRYRTTVEYIANLYVDPEALIDGAHEAIRERILYFFHLYGLEVAPLRRQWFRLGDRGSLISEVDQKSAEDPSFRAHALEVADEINSARWQVAGCTYEALRARGLLKSVQ